MSTIFSSIADTTIGELAARLDGELFTPNNAEYDVRRRVWNGQVDHHPAAIIRCRSIHDVSLAVQFANENGLSISVRSGGHNTAGLAVADAGVMLDLSALKSLQIDAERRIVRAETGLNLGEVVQALAEHGFATVTGTCAGTGLGGSTLGGGIGWLSGSFGMGIDNLLSAEIVTADGQIHTIDAESNPDLFWAVRGGGGNFGVVTAMTLRLHRVTKVLGGMLVYPLSDAANALRCYRRLRADLGAALGALLVFAQFPGVGPALMIQLCYNGDAAYATRLLRPLREEMKPALDTISVMNYGDFYMAYTPPVPDGRNYYETACALDELSDAVIAELLRSAERLPSALSSMVIHELHGAAVQVDASATAFALRRPHLMLIHAAGWEDEFAAPRKAWANQAHNAMHPYAAEGLYVNFMGHGSNAEVRAAYAENYARLAAIKAIYDPHNRFHLNQNILPQ